MRVADCVSEGGTPRVRYGWGGTVISGEACCTESERCRDEINPDACLDECPPPASPCECCDPPVTPPESVALVFPRLRVVEPPDWDCPSFSSLPGPGPQECCELYRALYTEAMVALLNNGITMARTSLSGGCATYQASEAISTGSVLASECAPFYQCASTSLSLAASLELCHADGGTGGQGFFSVSISQGGACAIIAGVEPFVLSGYIDPVCGPTGIDFDENDLPDNIEMDDDEDPVIFVEA